MKKLIISVLRDCGYSLNLRQDRFKLYFALSATAFFALACSNANFWIVTIALVNTAVSVFLLNKND